MQALKHLIPMQFIKLTIKGEEVEKPRYCSGG
jgi:hypothetical protein